MEQSSLMDTEICTQSSSKEDSVGVTGIPIKKDLGTVSLKSVVVLKDSDVTIRNGVVLMPNTIEMAQIKKQEKGQFKTQMCISSSMTEGDIKQVLVEAFPFLEGQRFYCAAAVDNRTRLDFHGIPRIWDGLYIKRKIKGNSALYILTHESTVTLKRSYDEIITPEESEKPEQPLKKETELANDQRHSACSNRCAPESDSMEQSSSSLFPIPKVLNHSLTVGQGVATLHPSNGSTVLKKCENLRPTEGPFLLQKLPDNLPPMMGCFFVPISAQQKGCVMSTAAASSNESAHQQKFMVTGGTVLQGAGLQKASVKQSSGRESNDNITDTERSELPIALQRVPHGVASSGLTPPMYNLNISGASSLQLCKDVHLEKMTQKEYQSAQTCKDGKEASRFLQETQTTAAEASSMCSTVTILKEESFSNVSTCQFAEKSVSNDQSSHSESGMETSDQNKEFSAIDMLCDVACSALKARITHKSSENKSKQLAMEDKSIIADICPTQGPLSGGNPFYISLKECLPEDVSSGFAVFRAVGTVELIKLDNFKFFGLKIPAASSPGRVDVKIQTSDGQYLGSTVFTYVDEDQEVFRRFITSNRLQSKFFSFLAQELAVRESKTEQDGTSKCSNPEKHGTDILHHSGQYDLRQMMGGLAIVDDLGTSSGCSVPVEESGGRDTAGSTREASESRGSHNNTESSTNMGNKDEACKDQNSAFDQSSVRAEEISALKGVVDEILPVSGSVEGEYGFCILLSEPLPDNVSSGMAEFQGVETAGLFKSNSFNLSGFVPAASSPGIVPVKVQTSDGQYLGSTVFTYFDEDQGVFRRFITSNRLQSKFFSFLAEGLAIRESETEQGGTSKRSNPEKHGVDTSYLNPSRQSGFTQILDCLAIDDRDSSVGSYPVEESGELKKAGNRTSSHEKTEINKYESCTSENSPSGQSRRAQYARERDKSMLPGAKDCK